MSIEEIVAARNTARAAFVALGDLLTTESQTKLYHDAHRRLDKADQALQVILTELGGPQTFEGGGPKP
jgi:hypothetical protein